MALVERDGSVRSMPIGDIKGETLRNAVLETVDRSATIMTDELAAYRQLRGHFAGGHHTVNHCRREYVRHVNGDATFVSTNTVESYFSLLKRAHYGIHHQMSKKHMHRYCNERSFMWDHRKVTDGERMVEAIKGAEGRRLMYREPA